MPRPLPRYRAAPATSRAPRLLLLAAGLLLLLALPLLPGLLAYGVAYIAAMPPLLVPLLAPALSFVVAGGLLLLWR
jgi:hypothetical protein